MTTVKDNDFVFYGYPEVYNNYLFFASKLLDYISYKDMKNKIDDLSCKFINGESYICAMIPEKIIIISL